MNVLKILNNKTFDTIYKKVLIKVSKFTRDILELYVEELLHGDCSTCGSNQAFEALQVRCKRCGKGRSGL